MGKPRLPFNVNVEEKIPRNLPEGQGRRGGERGRLSEYSDGRTGSNEGLVRFKAM